MAMILILSSDEGDTSEAQLEEWKAAIVESKALPGDVSCSRKTWQAKWFCLEKDLWRWPV